MLLSWWRKQTSRREAMKKLRETHTVPESHRMCAGTCRKETSPKCAANTNGNERIKHQTERPEPDMYEDAGEGVRKGTLSGEQGLAKEQLVGPYRSQSQKEEELGLKQHSVVKGTIPLAKKEQRQEHTRFQGNTNSKELWQSMHRGMPSLEERIHRQRQIEHLEKRHPEKKQQVQAVDSQVVLNRVILFPEDRGVKTSEQEQTGQTPADDVHRGQATTEQEGDVRGLSSCCQQMKQFPMSVQDTVSSVVQQTPSRASIDNINIYGEDSPIFCAPVYKPTLNFVQNLTVTQSCPVEEGSVASSPQKDAIQCKTELDTQKWTTAEVGRTTFGAQEAATQCRKELEERYTTTGSYVKLLPWDNRDMKHIKDMYTKLSFKNPYKSDFKQYVKKVEDIFVLKTREKQTVKRAIFCGLPGLGKSTIIGKIAYDWAVGLKILKQFTLLFVLRMSALDQTSDLLDAVFDQLLTHDTTVDKQDLKSFVYSKETSSRVLILLDGFDEFQTTTLDQSKFGSILKMLNRTVGRDWFVVVTTRPSHFADLTCKSLVEKPFTHVEVLGFGQEDIKQYVRRFYSEDVDNAEGLLDKIESSGVLSDLAKSPMLLLQMCLFWREKAQLPETLSRLYSEALRYIFRRKTPHLSENDVSEVVTDVAIVLGKTAVNGLIFPEQKLSFQETDFQKSALDEAIRAGILTSQRVIKYHGTDSNVEFIHKTFQECCAGQYCQNLLRHDAGEFQRILDEIHLRPEAFEYMLRFCCGDNEQCTKYVLNMLRKKLPDRKVAKLCLHCYFESQSTNILSYDVIDQVITEDVHIHGESNDSLNSIMWIVALISKHVSRADYLLRVHSVNISRCNLSRFSEVFASGLAGMKHLRSLHLICCELTGHNLDLMLSSIGQADLVDLIDLSLSGNQELGSSADAWAHRLRLLRNLKKLSLSYCGINSHDMAHITSSLTELAKLAVVDLSCNNNLGGCAETWAAGLKSMIHVKALEMKNCHLKGSDFKFLAEAISGMYDLRRCYFSGFGAELFISSWGNCIRLLIRASWITGEDMTDIFLSLSSWRDLFHVILHDIHLPSGSMVLWTPVFQNLTRLKRLDLNACILQSNDIEQLVAAMSQMPTLKEFTLKENRVHGLTLSKLRRFNRLGDFTSPVRARENLNNLDTMDLEGYTDTWAVCLKNLVHLRKLEWRRCDVGCRDVRHLADAVNHLDKLIYCSFSGGESKLRLCSRGTCDHASIKAKAFKRREMVDILTSLSDRKDLVSLTLRDMQGLSESLYLWTPLFQSLTNLQELSLVSCRLQSTEIEHLVTALRAMSTLRELSLKGNTSLGDAGNVWGLKLRYLGNLKKLSLSSCEITTRDMTYIALSVGEMTSLTDLDLSCNKELGGCAETWAARLKIMIHLKSLEMKNCGIRSSDVKFLAEAVGYMDNLVQWEFRGSGVELRTRSPSVHGGIRLNIVIQSMRSEDRAEIVRSLSNRRDLVSLYVRVSDGASGSLVLWAPQIQKLTNLEELHLSSHSLEKTDIEHLVGTLSRMPGLKELSLNGNRSLGGSANIWAPSLTKLVNLVHLMFCRCHLLATDIAYLSAALTELPILKEISLRGNVSLGGDAKTWAPHLLCLKSLRKLSLTSTKIRKEDMTHISFSVGKMANLTDLDLSCNKNLGNHAEIWASSMGSMVHLKRLEMKHCGITDRDVPHLVAAVSCMDNLMHCDVTGSNAKLSVWPRGSSVQSSIRDCSLSGEDMTNILQSFSGRTDLISFFLSCICGLSGSAVTWAQHLQQLTHLVKLHLINCSLQSTDIEHIAAAMNQMPTLKELSLKGNWCLGGSSTTWALSLRKMVHIVRLNLCWCGLTTGDIKHLASALSYLPILKELNLAENRSLGGDAKVWAPHLQCLKQLAKLDLTSTAVREADVGHIASSVSRMANLTHLNLSGNNDLGENAHSWAASLKDMIHLKKLEMRCCDLNCCYFKNLVEAISRMDNLTHCHFSGTKAELRMCLRGSGLRANIRACSLAGDDMADILQSFSKRMNLVSLIFEEIRGLGGSAVLWTAQLQNLTHLMELNFEASSLQSTDIEQLTATLNRMPSMKKYSLG